VAEAVRAFGPGRVNLIGEHTDYNDGLALPFAISAGVTVMATARSDDRFEVVASDLDARDTFALAGPRRVRGWRAFARGAVAELGEAGFRLRGARLEISGTVPRGSGLSSSAALEVGLTLGLLALSGIEIPDRLELARICSRIENEWVGARTGLLDQIASLCGQPGRALRVDFRSLEVEPVPLELDGYTLVTLDSGQRHANAGPGESGASDAEPGYNQRRDECARARDLLGVASLREATAEMAVRLPPPLDRRVRHVITENARVEETVAALAAGDLAHVGELLDRSHASLRDDYEVSVPAVEETVQRLLDAGAIGARIVGGGFGGHVLGLLPPGVTGPAGAFVVEPGSGAQVSPG
jgi:galactokinase